MWLAACDPTTGLQFEIDATGDRTATEVVVYIGKGDGQAASIAAEQRTPSDLHKGRFWPFGLDPESFQLTASERTATLSFAPGGDSSEVTIVAIGLTDGAPTSVATQAVTTIRTNLVEVWTLTLEPIEADVDKSSSRAAQRWGENPGEHTCVQAVDRAATDPALKNIFIGTDGDRDCDGHRRLLADDSPNPAECDDDWHDAIVKPSIDTLSCMEEHIAQGLSEVCIVGGPQCVDGESAATESCSHLVPFCAPANLCASCDPGATPEERFQCALETSPVGGGPNDPPIPFVRCEVDVKTANGTRTVCPTRLRLVAPGSIGTQAMCSGTPRYHSRDHSTGWSSTATIGGLSMAFSFDPVAPECIVDIVPTQVAGQSIASSGSSEHGLVAANVTADLGVVAPILFTFVDTAVCASPQRDCSSVGWTAPGETIATCLAINL